jgi:hypothetical protein
MLSPHVGNNYSTTMMVEVCNLDPIHLKHMKKDESNNEKRNRKVSEYMIVGG